MTSLAAELQLSGVSTLLLSTNWSDQAIAANDFAADVYIGLSVADDPIVETAFFSAPGYESAGGRHLAQLILRELPAARDGRSAWLPESGYQSCATPPSCGAHEAGRCADAADQPGSGRRVAGPGTRYLGRRPLLKRQQPVRRYRCGAPRHPLEPSPEASVNPRSSTQPVWITGLARGAPPSTMSGDIRPIR